MAAKTKQTPKIEFTKRTATGKGTCRKLRSKDQTPVVLYGPDYKEGLPGIVSTRDISPVANGARWETTLVELAIEGAPCSVLIRDVQRHPMTQRIRHIDFYQVVKGHKIKVEIPVRVINGELSQGVKDGCLINQSLRLVSIEVEPSNIPEELIVDATPLVKGSDVFVKDLQLPEGATLLTDAETVVLSVVEPKVFEEPTPEAETEEETAEVEVVAKGKASKEGEEEEEDAGKAKK